VADLHKHFGWAVLASEFSHVFCCVLPTVVTVLGALSNIGLMGSAPLFIEELHDLIHAYEVPIIVFSGVMVGLGWIVHKATGDYDCHNTGCTHPPCSQKKKNNSRILTIATLLFIVNLGIYFGVHRNVAGLEIFNIQDGHGHAHE